MAQVIRNQLKRGEVDDEAEDGKEEKSKANLDSGYAWLILLIMFLLQSSIGGSARLYGLVYAKEVEVGYYDREQASWPIATASAVENLAGILSPALVQWLSWRNIELISTTLFVLANFLAYMSSSLALDILALGFIQGLALSTCTVLSLIINNDYFERYRTTAYGLSMCGSTFGLLYLSPIVTWLLENCENFRIVYLALAGVFSFNFILVLFIRPRAEAPNLKRACYRGGDRRSPPNSKMVSAGVELRAPAAPGSQYPAAGSRKRSRFESHFIERRESVASISYKAKSRRNSVLSRALPVDLSRASSAHQQQQHSSCHRPYPALVKSQSGAELAGGGKLSGTHRLTNEVLMNKISSCSLRAATITNANDNDCPSQIAAPTARSSRSSQCSLAIMSRQSSLVGPVSSCTPRGGDGSKAPDIEAVAGDTEIEPDVASLYIRLALEYESQKCAAVVIDKSEQEQQHRQASEKKEKQQNFSLDNLIGLLRLPYLHCTWIMLALYYLIARIFVIILVDFAHDHGLDMAESTGLLNYWSFGELLGRLLLGSLIDLRFMSCKSCISLTCALLAALMTCMALVESYLVYAMCSLFVAALISLEYMLINVMMVEYIGKQMVTNCYSLAACISSLVLFGRPSMIGFFRDRLGSYDGLLLTLAGLAGAFAVLFYLIELLLLRYWPKSSSQHSSSPEASIK